MSEPFLAEVRIVGFSFPPRGNAFCDGQILPINQNQSLYSLLGTTYGGDGRSTFALPELRGRVPIHVGNSETTGSTNHPLGHKAGSQNVTLTLGQIPAHTHTVMGSGNTATTNYPDDAMLATVAQNIYNNAASSPLVDLANEGNTVNSSVVGGGQSHLNEQPYLAVNFIIALQGQFPSRN